MEHMAQKSSHFGLLLVIILLVGAGNFYYTYHSARSGSVSDEAVERFISNNPEVILDSVQAYQERSRSAGENLTNAKVQENYEALLASNPPSMGPDDASVTLVEFYDYRCGYCHKVLPTVTRLLKEDNDLRVLFIEFPILSKESELAAKAALAVYNLMPERYFDVHQGLFSQSLSDEEAVYKVLSSLKIDVKRVKKEMQSSAVEDAIAFNRNFAREAGIRGTPAFILNGDYLPGGALPYETLKVAIEKARQE
jgi:protein-disulfide isomerase